MRAYAADCAACQLVLALQIRHLHLLRGGHQGRVGRGHLWVGRHHVGQRHGRQVLALGAGGAGAVKELRNPRMFIDQRAEHVGGDVDQAAVVMGGGRGDGGAVAQEPAFAKGVAGAEDRQDRAR